ncbi:MAG TPA: hypothetical protein VFE18_15325 [Phenylobacterium sp.]|jgi:hypothetical protein|uniref:hypothetical protein n=1 Tax=Phenylobacterium sp. TaxID=1871053 RepID=UPI002D58E269|nr:hypothetical protein [Phenylobacterium sp.]HZZ69543.1 hypothetical protein [Phenylobacterium sp.]
MKRFALTIVFGLALVAEAFPSVAASRASKAESPHHFVECQVFGGTHNTLNCGNTYIKKYYRELGPLTGTIVPADIEAKLINCDGSHTGVGLGTNFVALSQFPANVLVIDGQPIIQIDRVRGILTIKELRIFDENGVPIASIHDNDFWIKRGVRAVQPFPFVMEVFDKKENMIFRVTYVNNDFLLFSGNFRYGSDLVTIGDKSLKIGRFDFQNACDHDGAFYTDPDHTGIKYIPVEQ